MPRLDSAVELEGSGGDIGCGSGVALDTEMHDHHAGDNTSNKGATLTATTTTKQAIPPPSIHDHHPGSDLLGLALESHQLPLPPHHTGTRSCSPPLSRSRSRSPSISSHPPLPQSSDYDHVGAPPRTKHPEEACVTVAVHESTHLPRAICLNVDANGNGSTSVSAVPPKLPSLLPPRETSSPPSTNTVITSEAKQQSPSLVARSHINSTSNTISSIKGDSKPPEDIMPFGIGGSRNSSAGDSRKSNSQGQLARNFANTNAVTNYEAGLNRKDRAAHREAINRFLAERVRADWIWPPTLVLRSFSTSPSPQEDGPSSIAPISEHSENKTLEEQPTESLRNASGTHHVHSWQERDDWSYSDDTDGLTKPESKQEYYADEKTAEPVDATGLNFTIKKDRRGRRQDRRIKTNAEMSWNDGLRCFAERRNAWTGARVVKRPLTAKVAAEEMRFSSSSKDGDSSSADEADDASEWEDVEIPIVDPILPDDHPIRAQITKAAYNTLYDKVVSQAMTPSIPINLSHIVGSCVQGWKRDGSWENKSSSVPGNFRKRTGTFSSMLGLKTEPAPLPSIDNQTKDQGTQTGAFRRGYEKIFKKGRSASGNTI